MKTKNQIQEEYLQEIFALPIGLHEVVNFDGFKLYGSDTLDEKVIEVVQNLQVVLPINEKIVQLIRNHTIIPAFYTKSMLGFLGIKLLPFHPIKYIMGFYSPDVDKIVLLINNAVTFVGLGFNKNLAYLTRHELSHMCSNAFKWRYYSVFKPELTQFWNLYFRKYFGVPKDFDSSAFSKFTFSIERLSANGKEGMFKGSAFYSTYRRVIEKVLRPHLKNGEINPIVNKKIEKLIKAIYNYFNNQDEFMYGYLEQYMDVFDPMFETYDELFGLNSKTQTMCIQEFFFPSEIICIAFAASKNKKLEMLINELEKQ